MLAVPALLVTAVGTAGAAARRLLGAAPDPLPTCQHLAAPPAAPPPAPPGWLARLRRALRRLFIRDAALYRQPWVLLAGEPGAGKSSLAASVAAQWRAPALQQDGLDIDGASWQRFEQGALLDLDGSLPARQWRAALAALDTLRPERPLDAIVLAVSARTLASGAPQQLQASAAAVRAQLDAIERRFGFILPVYVVVTATDAVSGFAAFWRALPQVPRSGMIGWSSPELPDGGAPADWTGAAFGAIEAQLAALQLRGAAGAGQIADADQFFLFPSHLQRLRAPLTEWLAIVFQPGARPSAWRMRGIYFSGSVAADGAAAKGVRADVDFVDDLVTAKVLAERGLARPARTRIWARGRVLRTLQRCIAVAIAALAVTLLLASLSLRRQVDALGLALDAVNTAAAALPPGAPCLDRQRAFDLFDKINRVHAGLDYLPWSWLDRRTRAHSGEQIANNALNKVILPALQCVLAEKTANLLVSDAPLEAFDLAPDKATLRLRQDLFAYLDKLQALERNTGHLLAIAGAPAAPEKATRALTALAAYAWDAAPPGAQREASPIAATLARWEDAARSALGLAAAVRGGAEWRVEHDGALYLAMRELKFSSPKLLPTSAAHVKLQERIDRMAKQLQSDMSRQVGRGMGLLAALDADHGAGLPELRKDASDALDWMRWVRESWLASTPQSNPCQQLAASLQQHKDSLPGYELHADELQSHAPKCYRDAIATLRTQRSAEFGPLVSDIGGDRLALNPLLLKESAGLAALVQQDFMGAPASARWQCRPLDRWQDSSIARATAYARAYQQFARKYVPAPAPGAAAPLFDRLARRQLEMAMNTAISEPQPGDAGLDDPADADARMRRDSARFAAINAPLRDALDMYRQLGLGAGAMRLVDCVGRQASAALLQVTNLSLQSRLYAAPPQQPGGLLFNLGGAAATRELLARQLERVQVLAGYAAPYVQWQQQIAAAGRAAQPDPYWSSTIRETSQYVTAHDSSGQAGQLQDLYTKVLLDLDDSNCAKATEGKLPEPQGDLFSQHRRALAELAAARCGSGADAQLVKDYQVLADRFDQRLAGHFPFGPDWSTEVPLAQVRQFFADNDQLPALRARADLRKKDNWQARRAFLAQLDDIGGRLRNGHGLAGTAGALTLNATFNAPSPDTAGADQVLTWTMSSGEQMIGWPNRPLAALDWKAGQAISIDLKWADRSLWRPAADPSQGDLQIDGDTASFAFSGDWALLRLFARHGVPEAAGGLLELRVPLALANAAPGARAAGLARLYLQLALSDKADKNPKPAAVTLPPRFPQSAAP